MIKTGINYRRPDTIKSILIFLILLLFVSGISAQDSLKARLWSLKGYVKDMQSVMFSNYKDPWISSNLIHNRLNFKWYPSNSFTFAVEMRNRFFYGDILAAYPEYGKSFVADDGFVKLTSNISEQKSYIFNISIDRLWLDYTYHNFEVTVGRQRINWGETFAWNPNDIFNSYNYLDFDYEEKPGSDAIRLQYFTSPSSKAEVAIKANKEKQITAAGLYHFNRWNYDIQVLAGIVNSSDYVIGGGWSGQVAKGGFMGELSYFRSKQHFSDTSGIFVASAGYDYSFKNSLFVQAECLYNGNNIQKPDSLFSIYSAVASDARNPFLGGFTFFAGASYPFTPLLTGSFSAIATPEHKLIILIPSFEYSLAQNLDLSLISQIMPAIKQSSFTQLTAVFLRMKWNF